MNQIQQKGDNLKATKCITQKIQSNQDLDYTMNVFKEMTNKAVRYGIKYNTSNLKYLSLLAYDKLDSAGLVTSYKLNAMSQACGILSRHKKTHQGWQESKIPKCRKTILDKPLWVQNKRLSLVNPIQAKTANQHSPK
jgi:hypothetical protein